MGSNIRTIVLMLKKKSWIFLTCLYFLQCSSISCHKLYGQGLSLTETENSILIQSDDAYVPHANSRIELNFDTFGTILEIRFDESQEITQSLKFLRFFTNGDQLIREFSGKNANLKDFIIETQSLTIEFVREEEGSNYGIKFSIRVIKPDPIHCQEDDQCPLHIPFCAEAKVCVQPYPIVTQSSTQDPEVEDGDGPDSVGPQESENWAGEFLLVCGIVVVFAIGIWVGSSYPRIMEKRKQRQTVCAHTEPDRV
mmetsp:Transcript_16265/g.18306  ORF Transcript_16265/g.18306 Transcript_16265/m.18306 type:complete len:253 (-) Transcript_16265:10-768(-)